MYKKMRKTVCISQRICKGHCDIIASEKTKTPSQKCERSEQYEGTSESMKVCKDTAKISETLQRKCKGQYDIIHTTQKEKLPGGKHYENYKQHQNNEHE